MIKHPATAKDLARSRDASYGFTKKNTQAAAARRDERRKHASGVRKRVRR